MHFSPPSSPIATASNALFPAVVPDDQIDPILQTANIASYCFHGNQGLLAKGVADKGAIVSNLNMNSPESRAFFTRVMTAVFVILGKNNTAAAPQNSMPFCYVGASQARFMARAKQSYDSDKETRNFYEPRKIIAFAAMLQEKDDPNREDCVEALVCTPFRVVTF
jgi:hypothetical protein